MIQIFNNFLLEQVTISIQTKANRPLQDRNQNTYNLILKRSQNDLALEMTLTSDELDLDDHINTLSWS